MNQPLYTNSYKKIIFCFAVFASTFFNILLFSSIGENFFIRIVWAIIGFAAVLFQTLKLRDFFNTKKKIKYIHFSFYIFCTIGSLAGTIGAGNSHIQKSKLKNIDKNVFIEIIDKQILEFKKDNNIKNAINSVMHNNTNIEPWALIRLIKENKYIDKIYELKNKKLNY